MLSFHKNFETIHIYINHIFMAQSPQILYI